MDLPEAVSLVRAAELRSYLQLGRYYYVYLLLATTRVIDVIGESRGRQDPEQLASDNLYQTRKEFNPKLCCS